MSERIKNPASGDDHVTGPSHTGEAHRWQPDRGGGLGHPMAGGLTSHRTPTPMPKREDWATNLEGHTGHIPLLSGHPHWRRTNNTRKQVWMGHPARRGSLSNLQNHMPDGPSPAEAHCLTFPGGPSSAEEAPCPESPKLRFSCLARHLLLEPLVRLTLSSNSDVE